MAELFGLSLPENVSPENEIRLMCTRVDGGGGGVRAMETVRVRFIIFVTHR